VCVADYDFGLQVIDVSAPNSPVLLGSYSPPGAEFWDVEMVGSKAYVADASEGFRVIDLSNPANPVQVGSYYTSGSAFGVAIDDMKAYVANATGIRVLDLEDPTSPVMLESYDTRGLAQGVVVANSTVYVADGNYGLALFDTDPCNGPSSVLEAPSVTLPMLLQNSPNPFNPSTVFPISIPQDTHVSLTIYSMDGRKIRNLLQNHLRAGTHHVSWNAQDDSGQRVSSGVYFARLEAGGVSQSRKVVLIK